MKLGVCGLLHRLVGVPTNPTARGLTRSLFLFLSFFIATSWSSTVSGGIALDPDDEVTFTESIPSLKARTLTCTLAPTISKNGAQLPIRVLSTEWIFNGRSMSITLAPLIPLPPKTEPPTYVVDGTMRNQSGNYSCVVTFSYNLPTSPDAGIRGSCTFTRNILVVTTALDWQWEKRPVYKIASQQPAYAQLQSFSDLLLKQGRAHTFNCSATQRANDKIKISYSILHDQNYVSKHQEALTLSPVQLSDAGQWWCMVSNTYAVTWHFFNVTVEPSYGYEEPDPIPTSTLPLTVPTSTSSSRALPTGRATTTGGGSTDVASGTSPSYNKVLVVLYVLSGVVGCLCVVLVIVYGAKLSQCLKARKEERYDPETPHSTDPKLQVQRDRLRSDASTSSVAPMLHVYDRQCSAGSTGNTQAEMRAAGECIIHPTLELNEELDHASDDSESTQKTVEEEPPQYEDPEARPNEQVVAIEPNNNERDREHKTKNGSIRREYSF